MFDVLAQPPSPLTAAAASFAAAVLFTPIVIRVAHARGLIAKPRADRWHTKPTALFGGVAIFAALALTGLVLLPRTATNAGILIGAAAIFVVGLVDDVLRIKPASKLLGQIGAACIAVLAGVQIEAVHPFLGIPLTILWIVAITNAFNLLDNMDGLSAGIASISAFFIVLFAQWQGNAEVALLSALLGGAAAGFLVFNFNPARVFMGDCGSMVLGYVLACAALVGTWHQASNLFLILAAPAMLLAVPIFDTTLVTVLRTFAGRPVSQGGRDHSSHRLVALGLSERRAVLVLYAVCCTFGLLALGGLVYDLFLTAVGAMLLVVGIFFFGVFLGQVPVYGPAAKRAGSGADGREAPALVNALFLHKRRIAEVVVDFVLVCAAYASAYLLRYEGNIPDAETALILRTLPVLIVLKMAAFFLFGVYRGVWKYVGIRDAINLAKAVVAGSIAVVIALLLAYRFEGLSRSVFVLDGLLLLFFAAGSRVLLRVFRETLSGAEGVGRRVLVLGAGDGAEMLLREIRNNHALGLTAVGLVDDDREKHGRHVHGVPVLGGREELAEIAARTGAQEIVIAIPSASGPVLAELAAACAATGLPYRTTRRLTELVDGQVTADAIRELDVLDVVQRRPMRVDDDVVRAAVGGKAIVVIGAGGTIGAAIARRTAAFGPARMLLVDRDDNALSRLRETLAGEARGGEPNGVSLALVDVTDGAHLATVLGRFRPDVVIHAAAVNQLGVLEGSASSAARVNVLGTASAAAAAHAAGAKAFVLVSSVKAGSTRNVLGATRRLAEVTAQAVGVRAGMPVRVIRLGNVLGSRGGILARFREQALAGGPITVTDPEATRFVLAAEEAAASVLAASRVTNDEVVLPDGAVLFAEHGEQVRILEIARAVSAWAQVRRPGEPAVEIRQIGLRPGESLRDPVPEGDRVGAGAGLQAVVPGDAPKNVAAILEALDLATRTGDEAGVRGILAEAFGDESVAAAGNVIPLKRG